MNLSKPAVLLVETMRLLTHQLTQNPEQETLVRLWRLELAQVPLPAQVWRRSALAPTNPHLMRVRLQTLAPPARWFKIRPLLTRK